MEKYLEVGEKRIYVEEYWPQKVSGKLPVVIFSHGFNGSHRDFEKQCKTLVQQGIGCISYDFCGGSAHSLSSGKTTEMSVITEKEDLVAVLDYVSQLAFVDQGRLFLFGASQGGLVSALVAEEQKERIAGLMLLFPALCIPDDWQRQFPKTEDIPEEMDLWGVRLGRIYCEAVRDWDIWKMIGNYQKPVLIMHGDQDELVPISYAQKAAKLYARADYHEFHGEGHGFSESGMEDVMRLAKSFTEQHA